MEILAIMQTRLRSNSKNKKIHSPPNEWIFQFINYIYSTLQSTLLKVFFASNFNFDLSLKANLSFT
ncbi:hypothetical protein SAMN06265349_101931 [Flavobacterium resistens]|uniref:Uncharacterized protein n=1 Tax=Flavobacterium resistens TaxID=443612 RepID=A0A521BCH7_9FLAO|nr:hypothetical protein SAMN06265349_101931 [Flavobacterium resistens]